MTEAPSTWRSISACCSHVRGGLEPVREAFLAELARIRLRVAAQVELGSIEALDAFVAPLTSPTLRYVLLDTGGAWTTLLCATRGGDGGWPSLAGGLARRLASDAATACSQGPGAQLFLHGHDGSERTIQCFPDGRRWFFHQTGEPLPFEEVARYAGPLPQRFDAPLLIRYLSSLGIVHPPARERFRAAVGVTRDATQLRVPVLQQGG